MSTQPHPSQLSQLPPTLLPTEPVASAPAPPSPVTPFTAGQFAYFKKTRKVEVITSAACVGGLVQIREGGEDGNLFWVKESDLKPDVPARFIGRRLNPGVRRLPHMELTAEHDPLIEFIRREGTIRVQAPPSRTAYFQAAYAEITGEQVNFPSEYASEVSEETKWGCSITVSFPSTGDSLVPFGLKIGKNDLDDPTKSAIFSNRFGWELFRRGLRLGRSGRAG